MRTAHICFQASDSRSRCKILKGNVLPKVLNVTRMASIKTQEAAKPRVWAWAKLMAKLQENCKANWCSASAVQVHTEGTAWGQAGKGETNTTWNWS